MALKGASESHEQGSSLSQNSTLATVPLTALASACTMRFPGRAVSRPSPGVVSVMVFLSEGREQMATGQIVARPNAALVTGVAGFTGELYRADLMTAPPGEAKAFLENCSAVLYCNLAVPRDEGLYLLGDSTPLYFVGRGPATLVYHTTWDRSPLGLGITANPKQPERWGDGLRAAGVMSVNLPRPSF